MQERQTNEIKVNPLKVKIKLSYIKRFTSCLTESTGKPTSVCYLGK